jgi:hypothetical protein
VNDNVVCVSQLVCHEDRKKAREMALNMGSGRHQSLVFRYLDTFPKPPQVPDWPNLIPDPTPEQLEERIATGQRIVGDPDECAKAVQKYVDVGCDQLVFGILATTLPQEDCLHTCELFGTQVIPRFDKDPVHSTTRYREAALAKGPKAARDERTARRPDRPAGAARLRSAASDRRAEHGLRAAVGGRRRHDRAGPRRQGVRPRRLLLCRGVRSRGGAALARGRHVHHLVRHRRDARVPGRRHQARAPHVVRVDPRLSPPARHREGVPHARRALGRTHRARLRRGPSRSRVRRPWAWTSRNAASSWTKRST